MGCIGCDIGAPLFRAKRILVRCRCWGMILNEPCPLCKGTRIRTIEIRTKP